MRRGPLAPLLAGRAARRWPAAPRRSPHRRSARGTPIGAAARGDGLVAAADARRPAEGPRARARAVQGPRTASRLPGAARLEFLRARGRRLAGDGARGSGEQRLPQGDGLRRRRRRAAAHARRHRGDAQAVVARGRGASSPTTLWRRTSAASSAACATPRSATSTATARPCIAVATHDQGVVAVLQPKGDGFEVIELDARSPTPSCTRSRSAISTATACSRSTRRPSEPNRLDGTQQSGEVVRYVPARGEGRHVVRGARRPPRQGDPGRGRRRRRPRRALRRGRRASVDKAKAARPRGRDPALRRRHRARRRQGDRDPRRPPDPLPHRRRRRRRRQEGDGRGELQQRALAAAPGRGSGGRAGASSLIDRDSKGFEHAALLTDLDGDGTRRALRRERSPQGGAPLRLGRDQAGARGDLRAAGRASHLYLEPDRCPRGADPDDLSALLRDREPTRSPWGPAEGPSRQHVDVEMEDGLARARAVVHDHAEVAETLLSRDLARDLEQVAEQLASSDVRSLREARDRLAAGSRGCGSAPAARRRGRRARGRPRRPDPRCSSPRAILPKIVSATAREPAGAPLRPQARRSRLKLTLLHPDLHGVSERFQANGVSRSAGCQLREAMG